MTTSSEKLLSQSLNFGIPDVSSFSKKDYNGGSQSWEAETLSNGKMVFANDKGLLVYNGYDWNLHYLPKRTICRSIAVGAKDRIYVGGQDEVGYFHPNENGVLNYKSIREDIPVEHRSFEDVWDFVSLGEDLYFRTKEKIFHLKSDNTITCIAQFDDISLLEIVNNEIMFHVMEIGLFKLIDNKPTFVESSEATGKSRLTGILKIEQKYIISTLQEGLLSLQVGKVSPITLSYQNFLSSNRITGLNITQDQKIVISTERGGVLLIDQTFLPISLIDKSSNLQTNRINCTAFDQKGNLWLGTANGIDQILYSNRTTYFSPDGKQEGAIFDIVEFDDKLYFATSNGLYNIEKQDHYDPFKPLNFKLVNNSSGQVCGLDIIKGQLFVGHNDGAFVLRGNSLIPIDKSKGVWRFVQLSNNKIAVGTYKGIDIYENIRGDYKLYKHINGFEESSRIIEKDEDGMLWVSHPYRGVFQINPYVSSDETSITKFDKNDGLPSSFQNYVFKVNGKIYVTSTTGVFFFDKRKRRFVIDNTFSANLEADQNIRRLFQFDSEEIWYVGEKEIGRIITGKRVGSSNYFTQSWNTVQSRMVEGHEDLYINQDKQLLISTEQGVLNLDYSYQDPQDSTICNIDKVEHSTDNEVLFGGYMKKTDVLQLSSEARDLKFYYSSNSLKNENQYSYILKGFDDNWSEWSTNREKEFTHLKQGKYTFLVKNRQSNGIVSEPASITFDIAAKWYETALAKIIYVCIGVGIIWLITYLNGRKYVKETVHLRTEQERSLDKIEKLKTEKLEAEISFRDKELASSTMHLLQKNETINKIREQLLTLEKSISGNTAKKDLRKIKSLINDDNRLEDDWENFAFFFDQVHTNFLQRLQRAYPILTSKDLKLAAYLRMNLTTKEIAPLLNISIRGVEISRYRLRKKMELASEIQLNEYMMGY